MTNIKIPTNKNFGVTFFFVFLLLSIFFIFKYIFLSIIFLLVSIIFLILGINNSNILYPLNKIWFKFGLLLGKIISPIVIGIIFFLVITPIGFLMKNIFLKNLLNIKKNLKTRTYWKIRNEKNYRMKDQF